MTTAIRSSLVAPIATIFATNEYLVVQALEGLTNEQLWRTLTTRNNAMLWIAGHLVHTKAELLGLLGAPFDTGWGQRFARGVTVGDPTQYPSLEEVQRVIRLCNERLHASIATLDDARLTQPPTTAIPGANTFADQLALFAFHESYHVGQMAYIRKGLGFPPLAG